jgi:hypothetical protein
MMMSSYTMHDTYRGHKDVAEFTPEDGHEFVEIWQRSVGGLKTTSNQGLRADRKQSTAERTLQVGVLDHNEIDRWLKKPVSESE